MDGRDSRLIFERTGHLQGISVNYHVARRSLDVAELVRCSNAEGVGVVGLSR